MSDHAFDAMCDDLVAPTTRGEYLERPRHVARTVLRNVAGHMPPAARPARGDVDLGGQSSAPPPTPPDSPGAGTETTTDVQSRPADTPSGS